MLRILLKKQFLETNSFYFRDRKTGKNRSRRGIIGYALLMLLLCGILVTAFCSYCYMLSELLTLPGYDWIYYSMVGILALLLGCFGSVFNTYASVYQAKDNELLLSMPIKPSDIMLSRVFGVFLMSAMYSALVWIPGIVVSWVVSSHSPAGFNVAAVVIQLVMIPVIAVLVTVLSCALGWVVAFISARLRNKSLIVVLISVVFLGFYYVFCMKMSTILYEIVLNPAAVGHVVKGWAYPLYLLGVGSAGSPACALGFTAIVAVLLALCLFVLCRSFIAIVTMNRGEKKVEYREKQLRVSKSGAALLSRELKHFLANPTYMLNSGLGIVILPVMSAAALIKSGEINELLTTILVFVPWLKPMIPVIPAVLIIAVLSMNAISASSVSLEGRTLWVIRSLPVSSFEILRSKVVFHFLVNALPASASSVLLGTALGLKAADLLLVMLLALIYDCFCGEAGLVLNLLKPNLSWTNASVPVKQSLPVFVLLFGGWILSLVIAVGCRLLCSIMSGTCYLVCLTILFAMLDFFMGRWLQKSGCRHFEEL